jgi:transcriptional regulator with XRE-family HTH domain
MNRNKLPVGDVVRSLREQRGFTQEELGQRVGVGQGMIGHIETGRRQPTLAVAVRLAVALGVTVDDLVLDVVDETAATPTPA